MKPIHRMAMTAAGAAVMVVLTAAVASAAGFLGPGRYSTQFADASAYWYGGTNGFVAQVNVNRNDFVFRPAHHDGSSVIQHATILTLAIKSPTFVGFDCFVIPDSAFVESNGVQAASLNVSVDESNLCPDFSTPLSGVVGASGGKGGPPPGGGGIPLPLTISLSWSGDGATTVSSNRGRMSCGGFSSDDRFDDTSARAVATGTLTLPDGTLVTMPSSDQGSVDAGSDHSDIRGYPNPLCVGK